MKSETIGHLEFYNKRFNFDIFWDNIDKDEMDKDVDAFYKNVALAISKSSPSLQKRNLDFEKHWENIRNNENAKNELFQTYRVMAMIGFWLEYKQIYKFDADTLEMVANSECKNLTAEELTALKFPYNTFSIENDFKYKDFIIDSVLVSKQTVTNGDVVLMIYAFVKGDAKARLLRLDIVVEKDKTLFNFIENHAELECQDFIKKVMNLVMYLCQPKAEVVKNRIIKKSDTSNKKKIKHFYNVSYDTNMVGVTLGNAIRNYKVIYEKGESTNHRTGGIKKPHLRCGHFHHYWVGKGRTELIAKYVEPVFVKGGSNDAVIHNVK